MITQDGTVIKRETPMARDKIKPPNETKAQLMAEVNVMLQRKHSNPVDNYDYLLNFFTSADLVGIRAELKK